VFSIKVLKDERIIIVAEQRPETSEEEVNSYIFIFSETSKKRI
jgi:hypothetical protein